MPNAIRGDVYDYHFGTNVAEELSEHRRALIISRNEINNQLHIAIAFPTSANAPPPRHYGNHVEISDADSWASIRQIKSVVQTDLGRRRGRASPQELERALDILVARLSSNRAPTTTVGNLAREHPVTKGTVWQADLRDPDDNDYNQPNPTPVLILDYNRDNNLAIVVEVEFVRNPASPVRIPVTVMDENQRRTAGSALAHHVRSIATQVRLKHHIGQVNQSDINSVNQVLLAMLDPQQPWPQYPRS